MPDPLQLSTLSAGWPTLITALLLGAGAGVLAIPHCAAMCGPLAAFACAPAGDRAPSAAAPLAWLTGRTISYSVLGGIVGGLSASIAALAPAGSSRWISVALGAALFVAALGLLARPRLVSVGRGPRSSWVSRAGAFVLAHRPPTIVLGALTGLLPCGALWAGLGSATASGTALGGAITMLAFSLTSAPGVGLAAWVAARRTPDPSLQRLLGAVLLLGAVVLALRPLWNSDEGPTCHTESPSLLGSRP